MGSDFFKDLNDAYENVRSDVADRATARARYRVQEDFNRELIKEIALQTGHKTLAAICFVEITIDNNDFLDIHAYHDWNLLEGKYSSRSSFHKSGDTWTSIADHYSMSKSEFWEKKENEGYGGGSYGKVNPEWIADNFWDGTYIATNGWPLGDAEFLHVYEYRDIGAADVIEDYRKKYVRSGRFDKYVQEAINRMK